MKTGTEWEDVKDTMWQYAIWILIGFVDGLFVILWVFIQYVVNRFIGDLELNIIDRFSLSVFQVFFAVSTIVPVGLKIVRDISIMYIRTQREIRSEFIIGNKNDSE